MRRGPLESLVLNWALIVIKFLLIIAQTTVKYGPDIGHMRVKMSDMSSSRSSGPFQPVFQAPC